MKPHLRLLLALLLAGVLPIRGQDAPSCNDARHINVCGAIVYESTRSTLSGMGRGFKFFLQNYLQKKSWCTFAVTIS